MKTTFQYISVAAILLAAFTWWSCDDEDSGCGTPSVSRISTPQNRDETIAGGNLGDFVIIQGANFCNVTKVAINGVEVDLKDAYVTASEITIQIPRIVPENVTNTLEVTTGQGNATASFAVTVPALTITGIAGNEFPADGDEVVITGKNLDLYGVTVADGKVFFGTTQSAVTYASADTIKTIVPAGVAAGSALKVSGVYGEATAVFPFKDTRVIFDLDPVAEGWNTFQTSAGPTPASISGNYGMFKGDYVGGWQWTEENWHLVTMVKLADLGITGGPASDYVVKFEVNVPNNWTSDPVRIWYKAPEGTFNYNFPWGGGNASGTAYKTTGWKTVIIPLTDFIFSESDAGDKQYSHVTELSADAVSADREVRMFVQGPDAKSLAVYFDNFRIVRKY